MSTSFLRVSINYDNGDVRIHRGSARELSLVSCDVTYSSEFIVIPTKLLKIRFPNRAAVYGVKIRHK
jgi:hypothetical protein